MPSKKIDMTANPNLHPQQSAVALELGLDVASLSSATAAIDAIESKLGNRAEEECARWFAISVLRHLRKTKWAGPNDSGLDEAGQLRLAKDCLAVGGGFRVSAYDY